MEYGEGLTTDGIRRRIYNKWNMAKWVYLCIHLHTYIYIHKYIHTHTHTYIPR
jgi:hypothetical protein